MKNITRGELLNICERSFVPQKKWGNRDTSSAQKQMGIAYVLLKDGCDFKILTEGNLVTDQKIIWVEITSEGFGYFENSDDDKDKDTFYLPTLERLNKVEGGDWY